LEPLALSASGGPRTFRTATAGRDVVSPRRI
jgi:hypothetical protein